MPYLIDGHNLIPKIRSLSLESADDEEQLILLLQEFCRRQQKDAEVYFDKAPAAQARKKRFGRITAHFVRQEISADQAIQNKLSQLAGEAKNWTVVSSDRAIQSAARRARAQIQSSESFAKQLWVSSQNQPSNEYPVPEPSEDDIEEWLRLFGEQGSKREAQHRPGIEGNQSTNK
jgi:uncharacterized protein